MRPDNNKYNNNNNSGFQINVDLNARSENARWRDRQVSQQRGVKSGAIFYFFSFTYFAKNANFVSGTS